MQWTLYCRVIDNLGDIGVAWRLAADLAGRGEHVRLATDDAAALAWMAPDGAARVEVIGWEGALAPDCDVVVELFGAGVPSAVRERIAGAGRPPLRINVEHLSAESYVERSHGLPSPRPVPGGAIATTWFFYPGFAEATGGLLREPDLLERRQAFGNGTEWLASLGIETLPGERRVSLFCYRNEAIGAVLDTLAAEPTLLLAAPGHAAEQVAAALGPGQKRGALRAICLPRLAQSDFDKLLWSCELNFVRGEDSLVRAVWAGAPFVWQLYQQDDGAHATKLAAFLDRFLLAAEPGLAASVRAWFERWNGLAVASPHSGSLALPSLGLWKRHCAAWRAALATQTDLSRQLIGFATSKR